MNPETEEEFTVEGQTVTGQAEFVPQEEDGTCEVLFNFDATEYEGDVVIYEEVYDTETNTKVAEHKDITYRGQTVTIRKALVQVEVRPARVISSIVAAPPVSLPEVIAEVIAEEQPPESPAVAQTGEAASYFKLVGLILAFGSLTVLVTYFMRGRKEQR